MKYCESDDEDKEDEKDEDDDECSIVVANSRCTANRCVCKENYVDIDGACRPSHNAPCNNDTDCAINDSECVMGVNSTLCRCKEHFTATASGICGKNGKNIEFTVSSSLEIFNSKTIKIFSSLFVR